jgi:hypothetical protein
MGIFRDLGQSILRTFDAGKTDEAVWTFPKKVWMRKMSRRDSAIGVVPTGRVGRHFATAST